MPRQMDELNTVYRMLLKLKLPEFSEKKSIPKISSPQINLQELYPEESIQENLGKKLDNLKQRTAQLKEKKNCEGFCLLIAALENRKNAIEDYSDVNICTTANNWTALHFAVENNHFEVAEALIKKGIDIECADHQGVTPFLQAVLAGNTQIFQLLLQHLKPERKTFVLSKQYKKFSLWFQMLQ